MNGVEMPRASIFGGNWWNGDNAGSRYANLDNWPDNSDRNISARGRCDDPFPARPRSRPGRPFTMREVPQGWSARSSRFGEHTSGSGRAGSSAVRRRNPRPAREAAMGKKHRNLIDRITADANMMEAWRLTRRGRRLAASGLEFKEYAVLNLHRLAAAMRDGSYSEGEPTRFLIWDPKRREIAALPFRDRIAQHALCAVIGPIFDATLLPNTFACRAGKGTHAGVKAVQSELRRRRRAGLPTYVLKTDFSRYFASIDRAELWRMIEAKISCRATLRLIEAMIPRSGIGLPIGSLVSQIFANVYGGIVDRHLQQDLGERFWYRYMDDLVVLGDCPDHLRRVKASIETLSRRQLGLRFSKWSIQPASRGVNFLGYRIWATHKLLRRDSVKRARRNITAMRAAGDDERLARFLSAWTGHASWADSHNLLKSLGVPS
jgi:hypothetical protein